MNTIKAGNVRLKRAYVSPESTDGIRMLVDRLWPRGVQKTDAAVDQWLKDLSPSTGIPAFWFCDHGSYR